jgi:hypothetical protein
MVPIDPQTGHGPALQFEMVIMELPDPAIPELNAVPQLSQKAGRFAM